MWVQLIEALGYPICRSEKMHLHHIDPSTKTFTIGSWIHRYLVNPRNFPILQKELQKCIMLTRNQHISLSNRIRKLKSFEPLGMQIHYGGQLFYSEGWKAALKEIGADKKNLVKNIG